MKAIIASFATMFALLLAAIGELRSEPVPAVQQRSHDRIPDAEREAVESLRKLHASISLNAQGRVVGVCFLDYVALLDHGFQGFYVTDADLQHLEALAELEDLSVAGCRKVSDAGVKHVGGLRKLRRLDLMDTQLTDAGIENLKGMECLEELRIDGTRVTGAALTRLAHLRRLRSLIFADTFVSDAQLAHLRNLPQLERLSLASAITDAGAARLAEMKRLRQLFLGKTRISDAGLAQLSRLRELRYLYIDGSNVSPAGIERFEERLPQCTIVVK